MDERKEIIPDAVIQRLASTGGSDIRVKMACPCIDHDDVPVTDFDKLSRNFIAYVQDGVFMTYGLKVAAAYELIIEKCAENGMTHVVIVESDVIAPRNALPKLLVRAVTEGHPFVCGSYPFKDGSDLGVAVRHDAKGKSLRESYPYERRGLVPTDRALPMGCCVIDVRVAAKLTRPLFWDGAAPNADRADKPESVSQDTFFTTKMTLAGHKPMLDTDIQCVHVCRDTRRCFGSPDYVLGGRLRVDSARELAVRDAPWWLGYQESKAPVVFGGMTASDAPGYFMIHGIRRDDGERVSIEVSMPDMIDMTRALATSPVLRPVWDKTRGVQ